MLFGKFIARTNEMDLQGNTLVHEIENLKPLVFKSFINFISSYNITSRAIGSINMKNDYHMINMKAYNKKQ